MLMKNVLPLFGGSKTEGVSEPTELYKAGFKAAGRCACAMDLGEQPYRL